MALSALWLGMCIAPVSAQEPVLTLPPIPQDAVQICPQDYWIISARQCGDGPDVCRRCGYQVWHFDACGRGTASSMEMLYGSLMPGVPVCFLAHGSFVEWQSVCDESLKTSAWLRAGAPGRPVHLIYFTWPSDDTPKLVFPIDVSILGNRASRYGFSLAELVSNVPSDRPICLLGHSHGARMVASTLHILGGGEDQGVRFVGGQYQGHRLRAVFAAAALDHHWMNPGNRYERAPCRAESILNLRNRQDFALTMYPLHQPFTAQALARTGFNDHVRRGMGPVRAQLVDCDVTPLIRFGHLWPYYIEHPSIARAIANHVFFLDVTAPDAITAPTVFRQVPETGRFPKWSGVLGRR